MLDNTINENAYGFIIPSEEQDLNISSFVVFVVGTIILSAVSRRSLFRPRSHGFYRFFAWEGLLILFLLNAPFWIDDPTSLGQIISWILLTASLYPVLNAVFLLRVIGKPGNTHPPGADFIFEQTAQLVTSGIYRYIRHPMYASLLYLTWGVFFKHVTGASTSIAVIVSVFLYVTAKTEEREDVEHFGERYNEYVRKTKMFVPFVW